MGDFHIIAFFESLLRIIANPLLFTGKRKVTEQIYRVFELPGIISTKLLDVLMHCPTTFSLYSPCMYGENSVDLGVICFF